MSRKQTAELWEEVIRLLPLQNKQINTMLIGRLKAH